MKKILYLHGFGSSGASGTVELLRRTFWDTDAAHRATVVAPDIPVDPAVAMPMLEELAYDEMPDLIVGTSMGGMYAQQLHGFPRICVNPSFALSKKYDILFVGKHKWLNRRKDGETEFHVTKETIAHFQEMEAHQFDGIDEEDRTLCHGLFGDEDETVPPEEARPVFEQHYPGMSQFFHGGHRLNAHVVTHTLIPFIRSLGII
ncbi:MAG: hypothetical protein J6334_08805 [Kiritimatiellae bacterium]|nr:hypothetical protein [Kiritimatiellia bacterium]